MAAGRQRALSNAAAPGAAGAPDDDIAALAKGGRTNVFGFVLRLIARLPFLFIAGQLYGAEALGRFAYAVIVVEFAAQLATLGLKRGSRSSCAPATSRRSVPCGTRCWPP
jgi:hypothetical protein